MNDHQMQAQRPVPTFTPQHAAAQNTAQPQHMQEPAVPYRSPQVHTPAYIATVPDVPTRLMPPAVTPSADISQYSMSVDDVRDRLHELNISKSKDTIQRYCRDGALDCHKLGMLKRYYATVTSVEKLIETMHPTAAADTGTQAYANAKAAAPSNVQEHEAASDQDMATSRDLHEAAPKTMPEHEASDAGTSSGAQVHAATTTDDAAVLQAKLDAANERIDDQKQQIEFLREEVKDARGNRRDVTTIAERMLGTLEAMAVGGRLSERQKPQPTSAPVREAQVAAEGDAESRV